MTRRLVSWLRSKFAGAKPTKNSTPHGDSHVEAFFTNAERLVNIFQEILDESRFQKRLLLLLGIGGTGKSTLLLMFRRFCRDRNIPRAMVSVDETKTIIDLLSRLASDLSADGLDMDNFGRGLDCYHSLLSRVESKSSELRPGVDKAAELAAAVGGAAIGVPALAALTGKAAGPGISWLRGFLGKPQIELLLSPDAALTAHFLEDLKSVGATRKLVLMIDTYEAMPALDDWLRQLVQQLPPNTLMVVAGREFPVARWTRAWPGWSITARIEQVVEMQPEQCETLILRYFSAREVPQPKPEQINEIIAFSRGLPLIVATIADVWIRYGASDFRTVKTNVVAEVVQRLMERVPRHIDHLLQAAGCFRSFNKELLQLVIGSEIDEAAYRDLVRFEFMRPRAEGHAIHDVIRDIMNDHLRTQDPPRHRTFHNVAYSYFKKRLNVENIDDHRSILLECIYHALQHDEDLAIRLFRESCEEYSFVSELSYLRTIVADVDRHTFGSKANELWRAYYAARILHLAGKLTEAETTFETLHRDMGADGLLRAYAGSDLGNILTRWDRLGLSDALEKAREVLDVSLNLAPLDSHLADALFSQATVAEYEGDWKEAIRLIGRASSFYAKNSNYFGMMAANDELRAAYVLQGNWHGMRDTESYSLEMLSHIPHNAYLKARTLGYWAWAWPFAGRCAQTEKTLLTAIPVIRESDDIALPIYLRHLGLALGLQGRFGDAERALQDSIHATKKLGRNFREILSTSMAILGMLLTRRGDIGQSKSYLTESLSTKIEIRDTLGIPEVYVWLGQLFETEGNQEKASECFRNSLEWEWTGRRYIQVAALVGIAKYQLSCASPATESLELEKAEEIARDSEYNDYLARLRLRRGQLALAACDRHGAASYLSEALVYALRFNRFVLDEVVAEINNICVSRGDMGLNVLEVLREFWKNGTNAFVPLRSDTISQVSPGLPLIEAERLARLRENGDGARQRTVIEQLMR